MWETQVQSLDLKDPLEKEWLPTLVLLLGEFHGQRSLVYYCPWGHEELDTPEQLTLSLARDRETQKELFKRPTSVTDTESPITECREPRPWRQSVGCPLGMRVNGVLMVPLMCLGPTCTASLVQGS